MAEKKDSQKVIWLENLKAACLVDQLENVEAVQKVEMLAFYWAARKVSEKVEV